MQERQDADGSDRATDDIITTRKQLESRGDKPMTREPYIAKYELAEPFDPTLPFTQVTFGLAEEEYSNIPPSERVLQKLTDEESRMVDFQLMSIFGYLRIQHNLLTAKNMPPIEIVRWHLFYDWDKSEIDGVIDSLVFLQSHLANWHKEYQEWSKRQVSVREYNAIKRNGTDAEIEALEKKILEAASDDDSEPRLFHGHVFGFLRNKIDDLTEEEYHVFLIQLTSIFVYLGGQTKCFDLPEHIDMEKVKWRLFDSWDNWNYGSKKDDERFEEYGSDKDRLYKWLLALQREFLGGEVAKDEK
jgi:hypothetical protein